MSGLSHLNLGKAHIAILGSIKMNLDATGVGFGVIRQQPATRLPYIGDPCPIRFDVFAVSVTAMANQKKQHIYILLLAILVPHLPR
jgi:hypothetical protein